MVIHDTERSLLKLGAIKQHKTETLIFFYRFQIVSGAHPEPELSAI